MKGALSLHIAAAGTRRDALRLLVAGAIAAAAGRATPAEARERRNRRRGNRERVRGEQAELCTTLCVDCSAKRIGPGANLDRCDFDDESFVDEFDLSSAHLARTCFARAELRSARFNGAFASRACFADANLTGASFRGANVSGAVFCGADLTGADFRGSNVTTAQLACAMVGCDTILPNGKRAVTCAPGEPCCGGVCGACGPCQSCQNGACVPVPNLTFACDGSRLTDNGPGLLCTANENTGICVDGACDCSSAGVYDDARNVCDCNQQEAQECTANPAPLQCCLVGFVCVQSGTDFFGETQCVACG